MCFRGPAKAMKQAQSNNTDKPYTHASEDLLPYLAAQAAAFAPTLLLVRKVWPQHKDPVSLSKGSRVTKPDPSKTQPSQ